MNKAMLFFLVSFAAAMGNAFAAGDYFAQCANKNPVLGQCD